MNPLGTGSTTPRMCRPNAATDPRRAALPRNMDALCDGAPAVNRAKWLIENKGMTEAAATDPFQLGGRGDCL